ncbi:Aste57867_20890 [Aphanomyces stellatus]|uniref:Aste57867_20890 protein n=1 Tax=Aphanomyces stellatus TaxID=120398 RepID=A0A485LGQ0_9STRA|nr:hypothetical protein As57867_020822 [Aphanomyces stellatus]VFT97567.1 Aste57867_20890 [Aphanomyces stellatus]
MIALSAAALAVVYMHGNAYSDMTNVSLVDASTRQNRVADLRAQLTQLDALLHDAVVKERKFVEMRQEHEKTKDQILKLHHRRALQARSQWSVKLNFTCREHIQACTHATRLDIVRMTAVEAPTASMLPLPALPTTSQVVSSMSPQEDIPTPSPLLSDMAIAFTILVGAIGLMVYHHQDPKASPPKGARRSPRLRRTSSSSSEESSANDLCET